MLRYGRPVAIELGHDDAVADVSLHDEQVFLIRYVRSIQFGRPILKAVPCCSTICEDSFQIRGFIQLLDEQSRLGQRMCVRRSQILLDQDACLDRG